MNLIAHCTSNKLQTALAVTIRYVAIIYLVHVDYPLKQGTFIICNNVLTFIPISTYEVFGDYVHV